LQDKDKLEALLSVVSDFRGQVSVTTPKLKTQNPKPILLKIAPDLSFEQIDEILELVQRFGLSGIIATNTTLSREGLKTKIDEAGGLSGKPLQAKSLEILTYIRSYTALPIISVGGIFTEKDVLERLDAGANLIQIYTSLVYEGPLLPKRLNKVLVERRLATSD
jgi:dihydroorotate dehydrogenase